jgi:DNA-binding CsgD family transcriptional regulator
MALPDKTLLLKQITTAIERKSCKDISKLPLQEEGGYHNRGTGKIVEYGKYFSEKKRSDSIKKLEESILELESQNDHLLYFIHYLYANFSHLVKDIVLHGDDEAYKIAVTDITPALTRPHHQPVITRREQEVLQLLVEGLCAKQIAILLFISETTVITHKKNLKVKFNAKNTVELVAKASAFLAGIKQ